MLMRADSNSPALQHPGTRLVWRFHFLKAIGQFDPKSAAILFDEVLEMGAALALGGRIGVLAIEQIIDTGRKFQALHQVLTEERKVHNPVPGCVFSGNVRAQMRTGPFADVLKFQSCKDLVLQQWGGQVELPQMFW